MHLCFWKQQLLHESRECSGCVSGIHSFVLVLLSVLLFLSSAQRGEGNATTSSNLSYTCPVGSGGAKCICTQLQVDCTGVGLSSMPLELGSSIQSLILKNNSISSIDIFASLSLPSLLYMDISYNTITFLDLSSFSSLTHLEKLNVSGNQLSLISEGISLHLKKLFIENCGLLFFEVGASSSLCSLKILHLGENKLSRLPTNAFSCMIDLEEIKLNNLGLTTLSATTFAHNTLLQFIDLSNNQLTGLPSTVFDGLDRLREINLAGNPWLCDCNLIWLKVFLESLIVSGGKVGDKAATSCTPDGIGATSPVTDLAAYHFSSCEEFVHNRVERSLVTVVTPLNWKAMCPYWNGIGGLKCSDKAVSCVYDFPSQNYSVVQYSSQVTGLQNEAQCRDQCWLNSNSYFMFENTSISCLCGDIVALTDCTDCSSSSKTSPSLCNNQYSQINGAAHVMYDVTISISPQFLEVMSVVTFAMNGGLSVYDTILWNFGDATTKSVFNDTFVYHTYLYPGQFNVTLTLKSSTSKRVPTANVTIQVTVVSTADQGIVSCPKSPVSMSDRLDISASFSSAWQQDVRWTREDLSDSSQQAEEDEICYEGWITFRGRCVSVFSNLSTLTLAHSTCSSHGAQLLRFYSKTEVEEMIDSPFFFTNSSDIQYYTGAGWSPTKMAYVWRSTNDRAPVFKETLQDSTIGSCVALGNSGLRGVQCDSPLPFICEKDPLPCVGHQLPERGVCYVAVSQSVAWNQAQAFCSASYPRGKLASIVDSSSNMAVSRLVSGQSWIGLRATTMQGHFTWQNSKALSGYSNWLSGPGVEPCVSINSTGQWQSEACDHLNHFVCEYFVGDEVKIPWLVTGYVPLSQVSAVSVPVLEVASPQQMQTSSSTVTIMPDTYFASSGHVLRWNIRTENLDADSKLAVQIWRPTCISGNLTRPGCGSCSPLFSCLSVQNQTCTSIMCNDGEYFCLLTQTCLSNSQPCTCAAVSAESNINCQNLSINSSTSKFNLVYTATVSIPASASLVHFEPQTYVMVQSGDVIGFQTEGQDVVMCETQSTSEWRHTFLSASVSSWMDSGDHTDPQAYQLYRNVTCHINAVYTTKTVTSTPYTLNYVTSTGDYEFTLKTNSSMKSCTVSTLDEVEGVVWVYPQANSITNAELLLIVEADTPFNLTVQLLKGSAATAAWYINGHNAITSSFTSSCPASASLVAEACQNNSSFLSSSYSCLSHSFSSGPQPVSIIVNVSNAVSFEFLNLTVFAYVPITAIDFYVNSGNYTDCAITVEVGKAQKFHLNVTVGDFDTVAYYEDGALVDPTLADMLVLERTYMTSTTHTLYVNVSNPLSWKTANLTVKACVRAHFTMMSFSSKLSRVASDIPVTISVTAAVAVSADITVTWSFNNEIFVTQEQSMATSLNLTHPYIFREAGNITVTVLLEDTCGDKVSSSMVVEVYNDIETLALSVPSNYVATAEPFNISIVVGNLSFSSNVSFESLNFTVYWGDNSEGAIWTSRSSEQYATHQYSTAGTYTVTVSVFSEQDPVNYVNRSITLHAQDAIRKLILTYDGPKHFRESLIFTVNHTTGTKVEYSLDFGDRSSRIFQNTSVFHYKYSVAGVYNALAIGRNMVSKKAHRLTLYVYDENLLQIIKITAKHWVAVNKTVEISTDVAAEFPSNLIYKWMFGNKHNETGTGLTKTSTVYKSIGVYTVELIVTDELNFNKTDTKRKDIYIEEPISGLEVYYITPIALKSPGAVEYVSFTASVVTGSNISFTWTAGGAGILDQYNVCNLTVMAAGVYTVIVTAKNNVSYEERTSDLVVYEVIDGLDIHCVTCSHSVYVKTQATSTLEASLVSGTNVSYTWNINDSRTPIGNNTFMSHSFLKEGNYTVALLATNSVSNQSAVLNIFAQDEVSGLNISVSSDLVLMNKDILFQASFSTGTNVNFQWTCDSIKSGTEVTLEKAFISSGYHQCTVNVSNFVSSATMSRRVTVLEEITSLSINHSLTKQSGSERLYAAAGKEYTFIANANTDFCIAYEWNAQHPNQGNTTDSGSTFKHIFQNPDTFVIYLKANNTVSSRETLITVEVQERLNCANLNTSLSSGASVFVGETVSFHPSCITGSSFSYTWFMNGNALLNTSNILNITFVAAGNSTIEVSVANELDTKRLSVQIFVYVGVSGVAIEIHQDIATLPYLSLGTTLDFSSITTSGSALAYNWTISHLSTGNIVSLDSENVSYTFNRTGTFQIDLQINNALSSGNDSLTLKVQGAITKVKMTWQDSVVATGSSVIFTGDVNVNATDVLYIWQVDGETNHTPTYTKQFSVGGVYKVSLTIQNNISSMTREDIIRVLDPIYNLQIVNCNLTREVHMSVPLHSTVDSGTNVTFVWFLEINNTNQTYNSQDIMITFPEEGIYNIYLLAQNDIDAKTTSCQLELHLPISQVTVSLSNPKPDYIFQNQPITFTANGRNLWFATYEWIISGLSPHLSNSSIYTTSIPNKGDFNLTLKVWNGISQAQATLNFTVKMFLCQLPEVTRVGAPNRSLQQSHTLELEVSVNPKGCTAYIAVHSWRVFQLADCTGDVNSAKEVDLGATSVSSATLVIKPRVLDQGPYCIQFVTAYHNTSVSETIYYMVNVTSSSLHAVIRGGNKRTIAQRTLICMDGTLSYNPDESFLSQKNLLYHWECTEINMIGNAGGGCFPTNSQSVYCYRSFSPGTYNVTLRVSAPGRHPDTAEQTIEVLATQDFLPVATVVCESCSMLGNYRVSSSQHVALSATCENCLCQPAFSWKIFEGQTEITLDSSQTSTGVQSEHLVLSKWGALKDGFDYTFVVYVSCVNNSSSMGTASLILKANKPPMGGHCSFTPTAILPLNQITVTCKKWFDIDDPGTLILFKIYVDILDSKSGQNHTYPLYAGTDETQTVFLGESAVLRVMVSDEFGAMALGGQSLIKFKNLTLSNGLSETDYLMKQTDDVLSALIKQASPVSLLQYAIALGQQLNIESLKEYNANTAGLGLLQEQSRAAIRDALTICLSTSVPISTLEDIQQMAYALKLLTDYSLEYLTEDSQHLMVSTIGSMIKRLQQTITLGLDRRDIPVEALLSVISNLLRAVNARIYSSSVVWGSGRTVTVDNFSSNFRDLRPEISLAVHGMQFVDISLDESHRQFMASSMVPLLEKILVLMLQIIMVDEEGVSLEFNGIKILASRSYAKDIKLQYLSDTTQIFIPASILSKKKRDLEEVLQVAIRHQQNPYTYGFSHPAMISMPVQTLSFYETNGSHIEITDLADASKVQIYMLASNTNTSLPVTKQPLNKSNAYDPMKLMDYKTVELFPGRSKIWQVPGVSTRARMGIGVHIQLCIESLANNLTQTNVNASTVTTYLGVNFSPSSAQYSYTLTLTSDLMDKGVDHKKYTFFLNNLTTSDRLYVVAKNNKQHTIKLSVGIYFSNCEYFNTSSQTWSNDGCEAQEESIASVTSCRCNHLTSFGGTGIVSITDIDFADLADLDFSTNPVVFIAVAIIFVLYVIIVIICRSLDHLDLRRILRIPLCGRDGPFKYEITVVTGRYYSAGTTAHIGIKMYGSLNKGDARHLTKSGAFQRNCRDAFLVAHDNSLGDITKILIWHDNTGFSPSWYLSHIVVRDAQTGTKFTFLINSWLSLDMEDGVIQKTQKVANEEELKKFYLQFSTIFYGLLAELHTWLSVSNRPDHSRFTRFQRATCCLTCVYLYMCINAIWYGIFKDQAEAYAALSWNSFGWEEIIIAIISTIMVLPFLFGLTFFFKKSRCKASVFHEALRPSSAQTLEIDDAAGYVSRDGGSYRTVTSFGVLAAAIERESTTDSFPVPVGLRRTAPMNRGRRKGSTDSSNGGRERPALVGTGSRRELWNKDNIMQSWPHTMPHWIKEEKAKLKKGRAVVGPCSTSVVNEGAELPCKSSRSFKTFHTSLKSIEDSDDDLQCKLDEAEAEITKLEEKRKKRKMRRESTSNLFDSDDDWVQEGLDEIKEAVKVAPFNPRKEPELSTSMDKRHFHPNLTMQHATSLKLGPGGSRSWHDGARPSIASSSTRSKSSVSDNNGRLRSLSTATSSQLPALKPSGCVLPPWCLYVAYAACAQLCMLSIILVLLYGYKFGPAVAIKWLLSLLFSVFASVLIVEPLKVLVVAVITAFLTKDVRDDNYTDVIDVRPRVEANEQIKDIKFRPLGGFALLQAKEEGKKKQRLQTMLQEVFVFTVMFSVFLAIVYINYNSSMYFTTSNIHNKFYTRLDSNVSSTNLNFRNMKSISEFWQWTHTVLAQSLHYRELHANENFGYLLGPARLRQIRGKNVTCLAAVDTALMSVPQLLTRQCVNSGTEDPDTDSYNIGWTSGAFNWSYSSSRQLNMFTKFGQSEHYEGGGYVQHLGQSYNNTLNILRELQAVGWLDLLSRAVFVEFTLYNPGEDLTSCVTLLVEFSISGGLLTSSTIVTEKLLRLVPSRVDPLMVCQVMFFAFVVYLTMMLISTLRLKKLSFFTHIWNWIDLLICLLTWTNTCLYIACVMTATKQTETYSKNLTLPAQLEEVALLHSILRYVHAFLVFLFCMKILRQIKFSKPLYKFYTTLATAGQPLMGVFFIFTLLLLTYAQFGYLIYGSMIYGYHSFQHSLTSLLGFMGSRIDYRPMFHCQRVLTHLFFLSFGMCVYGLVIALCVAVLTWSYRWSRSQMTYRTTLEARDYEMIEFMIKRFKLLAGIQKQKPSFRHVKFEGLPSLPSRATSSNVSSHQSCKSPPLSGTSDSGNPDASEQSLNENLASLKPSWEQVLHIFQGIEELEKQEEDVTKKLQDVVNVWIQSPKSSARDRKSKLANPKLIIGKPPLDPKATFARFRSRSCAINISVLNSHSSMTPPSTFISGGPGNILGHQSYSSQIKKEKPQTSKDAPSKIPILQRQNRVKPFATSDSSISQGNRVPGFYTNCSSNRRRISNSKHEMINLPTTVNHSECITHKEKQAGGRSSKETNL